MQTVFDFTDGVSGYIQQSGLGGLTVGTGWSNVQVSYNPLTLTERRGFMQFDTSSLPDGAVVDQVELYVSEALAQPPTPPNGVLVYIGTWIGATLDASAADYNGGTNTTVDILPYPDTWVDIQLKEYVSRTAETDIALRGLYSGTTAMGRNYNQSKVKCQLRVTWHMPPALTLIGVG